MRSTPARLPIRLWIFAVLPLLGLVTCGGFLLLRTFEHAFEQRMKKEVQMVARALRLPLSHAMERRQTRSMHRSLASALSIDGVYGAYLYDEHGKLAASLGRAQSTRDQRQIAKVLDGGRRSGEYGKVAGRRVYSYFVPLTGSGGQIIGLLQLTRRASDMRMHMQTLRRQGMMVLAFSALLMTSIVLLGYYGAVGSALSKLQAAMARVQRGDRDHRAPRGGPREIDTLTATLNGMLDSIAESQERIRAEQERRARLEARLRQSEKLAAIGQLAAGVAHELGTPLSVIDGRAQRTLRNPHIPEGDRNALGVIRQEVGRMSRIVRQLLDFGRSVPGQRRMVTTTQLIDNVGRALDDEVGRRGVRVDCNEVESLRIHVDPVRMEQALTNLVKNAVQAACHLVNVRCWREGDEAVLAVDDDGPGLQPEAKQRLFEPFFTTKPVDEGTGLGLAIVYAVAKEHRGAVEAGASEWGGASFRMTLPLPNESATESKEVGDRARA